MLIYKCWTRGEQNKMGSSFCVIAVLVLLTIVAWTGCLADDTHLDLSENMRDSDNEPDSLRKLLDDKRVRRIKRSWSRSNYDRYRSSWSRSRDGSRYVRPGGSSGSGEGYRRHNSYWGSRSNGWKSNSREIYTRPGGSSSSGGRSKSRWIYTRTRGSSSSDSGSGSRSESDSQENKAIPPTNSRSAVTQRLLAIQAIAKARRDILEIREQNRRYCRQGLDNSEEDTTFHQLSTFGEPKEKTRSLADRAYIFTATIKELAKMEGKSVSDLRSDWLRDKNLDEVVKETCPTSTQTIICNHNNRYRNPDGSCSNHRNPSWGMAFRNQARFLPAQYDDGLDDPRTLSYNRSYRLPSARTISNMIHTCGKTEPVDTSTTVMFMQFGQFIDHDIVQTPLHTGENGTAIDCCDTDPHRSECFVIKIPYNDPHFKGTCMNFVRSLPGAPEDCIRGSREQINQISSVIDASAVYGSSKVEQDSLRALRGGLLKTSAHDLLPPKGSVKGCRLKPTEPAFCQKAGDARVNVIPGLGAAHTLFVREHNRLAKRMAACNPGWNDEMIFQETRKLLGAILQHITYNEYLPLVLGEHYMNRAGLKSTPTGYHYVYDPRSDPTVANGFAAAAFRFQHASIPSIQGLYGKNDQTTVPLENTYFNPHLIMMKSGKGLDEMVRWMVQDNPLQVGRFFVKSTRDLLFIDSKNRSLDLAALNTQRGRDHGIPPYNAWRAWCRLPKVTHFGCSGGGLVDHTTDVAWMLKRVYRHPDDMDLYTAGITEKHVPGGSVGPTFACIIAEQFRRLKTGDLFWYENGYHGRPSPSSFTQEQVNEIKKMSLSKLLCENTDLQFVQRKAMEASCNGNPVVPCSQIPDININMWTGGD